MLTSSGMHARKLMSFAGVALGALVLAACATKSVSSTNQRCLGTERLLVRNETGGSVDVYARSAMIGTVGPGSTELGIAPGTGRVGNFSGRRTSDGVYIQTGGSGSPLRFQVVCR